MFFHWLLNEPFVHGLTRREAGQVELWMEAPNKPSPGVILAAGDRQCQYYFANRRFKFNKRSQLFIRTRYEPLSIAAMCVHNPDRLPVGINC